MGIICETIIIARCSTDVDNTTKNNRILVVDDDEMNNNVLVDLLKPYYEIIITKDGSSALEAAQKYLPNIILLDIIMPGMSGFDVIAKLKDSEITMNIPVIFITGLSDAGDEEKGLSLGAVDYITKPFNKSIVKARINTHLKIAGYVNTIEKLCMVDALTGLPNRRSFEKRMSVEWGRAFREKRPLGMIMFDIDRFKLYNDTYGHPQGDVLLQTIANVVDKTLNRPSDFFSRWGGEEFIVLLPDTDIKGTLNIAEKIRKNVANTIVLCADGTNTSITVSLGADSMNPSDGDTLNNYIDRTDKLLYAAKENGRDQVYSSLTKELL